MRKKPYNAWVIGGNSTVGRLQRALAAGEGAAVVKPASFDDFAAASASDTLDLLFVDVQAAGANWPDKIAMLRRRAPDVPLIAIVPADEEAQAILALQAGAQDCVSEPEIEGAGVSRTARHAIERSRFLVRRDVVQHQKTRDREFGGLNAINSEPALPVTRRSFGLVPLQHSAPDEFQHLVARYGGLLDRALLGPTGRDYDQLDAELDDIANRLGLFGAGPRDAVDLHKAAMIDRLEGELARKNRAYIEEGRLLLVQLMGHLVAHYRRLSWGRGPAPRTRFKVDDAAAPNAGASGKKEP